MELVLALSITLGIEIPIYMANKEDDVFLLLITASCNLFLNPLMNWVLSFFPEGSYWLALILLEAATFLIEGSFLLFRVRPWYKAYLFALLANLTSFAIGLGWNQLVYKGLPLYVGVIIFFALFFVQVAVSSFLFARKEA